MAVGEPAQRAPTTIASYMVGLLRVRERADELELNVVRIAEDEYRAVRPFVDGRIRDAEVPQARFPRHELRARRHADRHMVQAGARFVEVFAMVGGVGMQ